MSTSADIIEKIKKLLRLARSANSHEAQLAMERAIALAREHEIAVDDLNPDDQAKAKVLTHQDTPARQRINYDKEYAVRLCAAFFHITPVYNSRIVRPANGYPHLVRFATFVGTAPDVEIALYVYGFLVHHFQYCWANHRGRIRNRHAYIDGMFRGLFAKLSEALPPRHAKGDELALSGHDAYIAEHIGETTTHENRKPDNEAHAARWVGFIQGQKTNIPGGLKPGAEPAPLALR